MLDEEKLLAWLGGSRDVVFAAKAVLGAVSKTSPMWLAFESYETETRRAWREFHERWSAAVGTPGYNKQDWRNKEAEMLRRYPRRSSHA